MTISVAMAAYNGGKYIEKQIESILVQLRMEDELVISINQSEDDTEEVVNRYKKLDSRVKVLNCTQRGVLQNFENAIKYCNNDIIFLADQDDVWEKDKVQKQLKLFSSPSIGGVCHGCKYIDEDGILLLKQPKPGNDRKISAWEIIKKNPVQGSCLAFRKEMREWFLPFPKNIPMHDSWIGLWICKKKKLLYTKEPLLLYRQHNESVTVREHKNLINMIHDRIRLVAPYIYRIIIARKHRNESNGNVSTTVS